MKNAKFMMCAVCGLLIGGVAFAAAPEMVKVGGEGKIAIVNTCEAPTEALNVALRKVCNMLMINFEIKKGGAWTLANAQKCFDDAKASAAVFIVKDPALPMSLVAMESKWGIVNSAGLDESGVMKETLRVATLVLGGAASRYTASSMRPVFSKEDLAKKAGEIVTFDSIMAISNYLPDLGIKPYQMMDRQDAIAEGLIKDEKPAEAKK